MKGQIALIDLLISAVALTLGLSASKQAVTETRMDLSDELQKQAFNLAEGGIDYYLGTGQTSYKIGNSGEVGINITNIGNTTMIDFNEVTLMGTPVYYWLVGHDENDEIDYSDLYDGTSVTICTKDVGVSAKIDYFYRSGSTYSVIRHYENVGKDSDCKNIAVTGTPLLLAVTPVTDNGKFTVSGNVFPAQGKNVTSLGVAGAEKIKSKVSVRQRYEVPSFMLEGLMSGGNIGN